MNVQLNLEKLLEVTQAKLQEVSRENLMLHCVVQQQLERLTELEGEVDAKEEG